jgi:ribosomal protein S18 acetylase RimI-like enzyme
LAVTAGVVTHPGALASFVRSFGGPPPGAYDPRTPELTYIAVERDARGRRIGEQLVRAFTTAMHESGIPAYELSVDDENMRGRAFYERLGFVAIGRYEEFGRAHIRYRVATQGLATAGSA